MLLDTAITTRRPALRDEREGGAYTAHPSTAEDRNAPVEDLYSRSNCLNTNTLARFVRNFDDSVLRFSARCEDARHPVISAKVPLLQQVMTIQQVRHETCPGEWQHGRRRHASHGGSRATSGPKVSVMTVLLVLLTFSAFILLDYLLTRRRAVDVAAEPAPVPAPFVPEPVWVAGFQVPESLHYHRGHTWARVDSDGAVVVGLDDFARRLVGPAADVRLPAPGEWLRPGEPAFDVRADGRTAALVAPLEGEVLALNPDVVARPALATDDPYGRGWLVKLRPTGLTASLRNLLSGSLARRFMEDAREALDLRLMAATGSVLHDGGEPSADFARHLPEGEWRRLVRDFLLT